LPHVPSVGFDLEHLTTEVEKNKPVKVLIKEPQLNPVTHQLIHADLYQVDLTQIITADVPLVFVGESRAIEDLGGSLIESKTEVEVECLPQDLPHELSIDISTLTDFENVLELYHWTSFSQTTKSILKY